MMELAYKPDLDDARRHWEAFWAGEIIDRPCTAISAPKSGAEPAAPPPGLQDPEEDLLSYVNAYDRWAAGTCFCGEAMPFFFPNFGPDIYAAFFGGNLQGFQSGTGTSWAKPYINDWKIDAPKFDKPFGYWWERALEYVTLARSAAKGKFGIGAYDLHSNMDLLSAARGPQHLCMDLIDCPDDVEAALNRARRAFAPAFDALYEASGQDRTGSSTWLPLYCEGKYSALQCDFACMISPTHFRRFVLPVLEEEAAHLDHNCYHYDGPDALIHLEDVLSLKAIDSIQWVPGEGNAPFIEWMDLLKKIQAAGKSVYVAASVDQVKIYHKELRPDRVVYHVWASSEAEANSLLDWLKANT